MTGATVTTITTTESKPGAFFLIMVGLAMITGSFVFPIGSDVPYSPLTPAPLIMANRALMHYAELLNMTGVGAFVGGCVLAIGGRVTQVSLTPATGGETADDSMPTAPASPANTIPWGKIAVAVAMIVAILLIRAYHDSRESLIDSRLEAASRAAADRNAAALEARSAAEGAVSAKESADAEASREAFHRAAKAALAANAIAASPEPQQVVPPPPTPPWRD